MVIDVWKFQRVLSWNISGLNVFLKYALPTSLCAATGTYTTSFVDHFRVHIVLLSPTLLVFASTKGRLMDTSLPKGTQMSVTWLIWELLKGCVLLSVTLLIFTSSVVPFVAFVQTVV